MDFQEINQNAVWPHMPHSPLFMKVVIQDLKHFAISIPHSLRSHKTERKFADG